MTSSQSWLFLDCNALKLKYRVYDKMNSLATEKREKREEVKDERFETPTITGFVKCLT